MLESPALGFVEHHGQDDVTRGVRAQGEYPSDLRRHEDPMARRSGAVLETNLVYGKQLWYIFLHSVFALAESWFSPHGHARNALFS